MWMSLARRSSALKMVVSTSLMTGAMSLSAAVSLSMERVSSVFVFVADDVEREALGDFFEHALGLLGFLEQVGNLREGGDFDAQLLVEQQRQARRSC